MSRAQSHVVGVALMLGIAVVALGGLTAAVGSLVDAQTATADAARVADEMDSALRPVSVTGPHAGAVRFADGTLSTVDRDLRVLRNGTVVATHSVGGLVFDAGERRVAFLAGAIVRGSPGNAWLQTPPLVTGSERNAVIAVGVPHLGAGTVARSGHGPTTITLRTNVSHSRRDLGTGRYAVAVETVTPDPFARHFREANATVERRDIDGDDVRSVVATYPGVRRGYLAVHDLALEVDDG
ncbi:MULTISPECIES: DUF7289 family protein [Salinibaculum]|uniref:DUF7289 family protein n=1 Tax=Salinibaculum TaxID=2732368 RepID=UPI0030D0BB28